ncbi:histidinol dehydrogenase [Thermomicrobiaceae bacterium CFH 74404]|uniref:Histidinol dehydrogenase n=1 Tax=Thermalbibacter longus TaxID=2951981 RepID=A0AA42B9A5_9BACT|nr:histidinol dehydrogenase [Thermalbibacter longus]MCM8748246.1 histidinol dehydrogenase [Thermalbibacter longus]
MSQGLPVRVFEDLEQARNFLLRSRRLEQVELPPAVRQKVREVFGADLTAMEVVQRIVDDVRRHGDAALHRYSRAIDGLELAGFAVTEEEFARARAQVPEEIRQALALARDRIEAFHQRQIRQSWLHFEPAGGFGQLVRPLERVGVYAPAGRAPYPSSLLMSAVPARVAGVEEIVACAPPSPDGSVSPVILVAAELAGIDRVFKVGGAQAIAAMAYGTESIPRVDKIVGPGNIFVVLAKRLVYGDVDIDQLPGPTETLLIADASADPALCAADMLAQAEHDPLASAVLLTTDAGLAREVVAQLERQLTRLERASIAAESLATNGAVAVVPDLETAFELANAYAPEHLCLLIEEPWAYLDRVRHAGGVFVGESSPEVIGDYTAGPSHVMPTGQTARFSSPINVDTFVKVISVVAVNPQGLEALGPPAATLARAEGLTAHAAAIEQRLERRRPA